MNLTVNVVWGYFVTFKRFCVELGTFDKMYNQLFGEIRARVCVLLATYPAYCLPHLHVLRYVGLNQDSSVSVVHINEYMCTHTRTLNIAWTEN